MRLFLFLKPVRLLLAFMVSIWMAGGCLFGCSNTALGAEAVNEGAAQTIEAAASCHAAASSHHCCATKKSKQQVTRNTPQPKGVPAFLPAPRGLMKDCPLAVNATAATSKSSTHVPDSDRTTVASLSRFESKTEQSNNFLVVSYLPNRGPTHLRCCVFLI
jgi:hypothetical protein